MKKDPLGIILKAGIALLFAVCLILVCIQYFSQTKGAYACIYQDGTLLYEIDLSQPETKEYTIEYQRGSQTGYNVVQVKDHKIGIIEADCPDKTCVHMGMTSSASFPITCLPHKLIIEVHESDTGNEEIDVITH